jgi:cation transport ATPase
MPDDTEDDSNYDKVKRMIKDASPHTVSKVIFFLSLVVVIGLFLGLVFTSDHTIKYRLMISLMVFIFINCLSSWLFLCSEESSKCERNNMIIGIILFLAMSISAIFGLYFAEGNTAKWTAFGFGVTGYIGAIGCAYLYFKE